MNPRVAIIVLNYNKKEDTIECLDSLTKLTYDNYETIVVDNHSTDGSPEHIRNHFPRIRLVRTPSNLGAPGGRNYGWCHLKKKDDFDYVFFLDDDSRVEPESLGELVSAIETDSKMGIAASKGFTRYPSNVINSAGMRTNFYLSLVNDIGSGEEDQGQYDEPRYVDACTAFALLVSAETIEALDGFDETFNPYGFEDADFCLRAKRLGYLTGYVPTSIVYHKGTNLGRKPLPEYEKNKIRNYIYLLRNHTTPIQKLCCLFAIPTRAILNTIMMVRNGDSKVVLYKFKGMVNGLISRKEK